jgi:hypothetical protein
VSITSAEPVLSTLPPKEPARRPASSWRASLKWLALALACLWILDLGISLLIQHSRLNRAVTSRLEAAFGRPVQVGSYSFSLWAGPVLEANSVTVGEDPRFGQEYFLRADSLAVRVRWLSIFSGHLELSTISLSHPTLNLVRDANGDWNLAEWLPRPANAPASSPGGPPNRPSAYPVRFRRIDVDSGRINFKRGDEKLPFAFVDVGGTLENEGPARWRLDLLAVPFRAAVIVQQPGVLHLVGHLGGTSSRLRPAEFDVAWDGASITDVLRLARNRDYGFRGNFGMYVAVRTRGDSWLLQGKAFLTELHRWDLALRPDNPALNIIADAALDPSGSRLELNRAGIELPHSHARITGALDWTLPGLTSFGAQPLAEKNSRSSRAQNGGPNKALGTELHITSDALDLSDALAWARAFHPGIADSAALRGSAQIDLGLAGWLPRLEAANLDLPRAEIRGAPSHAPLRLGRLLARYDRKTGIELSPTTITLGAASNSLRIDGAAKPDVSSFVLHVQGATAQLRDAVAAANEFGWNLARGWDIAGPARCDLHWQGTSRPWRSVLSGSIEWGTPVAGVSLHPQFLNLPVEQIRARSEFKPGATHTTVSSAQAFGAGWTGTLDHDLSDGWQFAVSGDSLSAAGLDRWLNPRWRESFLDRVLPFLNSHTPPRGASQGVRARGRISLDQFALPRIAVHHLRGDLALDGRHLEVRNLDAQFYGGQLDGSVTADLQATPRYEANIDFSGVDLHALSAEFPSLADIFSGSASAKIAFNMQGATRADLLDSLACRGAAHLNDAAVEGMNLAQSIQAKAAQPGASSFRDASAAFACAARKIQFDDLRLASANSEWEGTGTVTYAQVLDLLLHPVPFGVTGPHPARLAGQALEEYRITGTLATPQLSPVPAAQRAANQRP